MAAERDPQLTHLFELARAHGVATSYENWERRRVDVDPDVIRTVLSILDVETGTPAAVQQELARARERASAGTLPPTVVTRPGRSWAFPGKADGIAYDESGAAHEVRNGAPVELPLGWYRLRTEDRQTEGRETTVIVAPERLPEPPPAWGWMLQLYALHSGRSWGAGDLADLRIFTDWAAGRRRADGGRADLLLLNPLHAVATVPGVQASPYSPSSRRFANALYLAVEDTEAYRRAAPDVRARVDALRPDAHGGHIDYDRVWRAKREAMELLFPYAEPVGDLDPGLRDFAAYSALAEVHGPDWRAWPDPLRRPGPRAVTEAGDRITFHAWLQRETARQLGRVQDGARRAGMRVGLVHDLAVGVDPGGADGWLLQDVLARGVTAGAPPDDFNRQGQDWGLAAWRPDRLAETGYAAYRDMLRSVLAHAGGVRVDHVMGLWRLWWVPPGASPDQGTYVSYDDEAMLAILTLEAHRAGAAVVAEDLGTVEPRVSRALRDANILGSQVLWFSRSAKAADDGTAASPPFQPPAEWPAGTMASISTHDLPTAAGMLSGEHVRVRAELGLLGDTAAVEAEAERARDDRRELIALLRREGLIGDDPTDDELIVGMHRLLAAAPSRFLLASPYDVLGETRQPNLPGTVDQYPNWRIRLPVSLEEMRDDPRMREVASLLGQARPRQ